jgi:cyclic pyranopterin phosphate synthase
MKPKRPADRMTHLDRRGRARMVDIQDKPVTAREAMASGTLRLNAAAFRALRSQSLAKGDALALARVAGIAAAKRTAFLIPLCHIVPLDHVGIDIGFVAARRLVRIDATARARFGTGVEMEALVAASAALLTLYDMAKSLDRGMVIGPIRLIRKSGGRSGLYRRGRGPGGT